MPFLKFTSKIPKSNKQIQEMLCYYDIKHYRHDLKIVKIGWV